MKYYHIRIDYYDSNLKVNQTLIEKDRVDLDKIKERIITPYLNKDSFLFKGTLLNGDLCRKIGIFSSDITLGQCEDIIQNRYPNAIIAYSDKDMLPCEDLVFDITSEITEEIYQQMKMKPVEEQKPRKVFISHSSKDVEFVKELVNLLEFVGFDETTMFCSSVDGYGIPLGENIFDFLRKQFLEYELFVIFVHSSSYYDSAVSLNEMGAAWVLKSDYCSFLTKDFSFGGMTGVVPNNNIAIKVDNDDATARLNEFKDKITIFFGLQPKSANVWECHRNDFLRKVIR